MGVPLVCQQLAILRQAPASASTAGSARLLRDEDSVESTSDQCHSCRPQSPDQYALARCLRRSWLFRFVRQSLFPLPHLLFETRRRQRLIPTTCCSPSTISAPASLISSRAR